MRKCLACKDKNKKTFKIVRNIENELKFSTWKLNKEENNIWICVQL